MKTATTKLSKKAAAAEIAAILRRVRAGVDICDVLAAAEELADREQRVADLRAAWGTLRDEFPTWQAFYQDAIEVGEWNMAWGDPGPGE